MGAEAHWLMGRVMPREFLEEVGKYIHHVAPEREDELMAAIKARAGEIAETDKDLAVDGAPKDPGDLCNGAGLVPDPPPPVRRGRAPGDPLPPARDGPSAAAP